MAQLGEADVENAQTGSVRRLRPMEDMESKADSTTKGAGAGMKQFAFYWLGGTREVLEGTSAHDALSRAGYGNGAVRALDFWAPAERDEWQWNESKRGWEPKPDSEFGKQIAIMRERYGTKSAP